MKLLSIRQPWASLVALGYKSYETRDWSTSYRGPVIIHASGNFPSAERAFAIAIGWEPSTLPLGCALAVGVLTDCLTTDDAIRVVSMQERALGNYGPRRYAFRIDHVVALDEPIEMRGQLSLRDADPADLRAVLRRLQTMKEGATK
jgi:hypothetical protein